MRRLVCVLVLLACEPMGHESSGGSDGGGGTAGGGGAGGSGGGGVGGGTGGAGGGGLPDAGPPPMGGTVGPNGGTVDRFAFVAFGDVRPQQLNDDSNYPVAVITQIMQRAHATPAEFAVATGDYMFASTASSVSAQVQRLLGAEQSFPKPIFHALGNHECTGGTASNCPNGTETYNVRAFMMQLVPFAQKPYFTFDLQTQLGTAKFVFVAANAWDSTQQSWLETQLARSTQYTIILRHEPPGNLEAPGAAPSDAVIAAHPYTLALYGHSHEYRRINYQSVISGNAGAPISFGTYGFLYVVQRTDGNVQIEEHRSDTGQLTDGWIISPTGQLVL